MAARETHGDVAAANEGERRDAEASGIGRRAEGSLRFAVRAVDRQIVLLGRSQPTSEQHATAIGALSTAWAALLEELAIGPAPELRSCPACGRLGMSAATLCGYCWTRLSPPAR